MQQSLTPMLEQYLRIKEGYKNALLFFRLGDFYEMFFEDAQVASKILGIALTSRDGGKLGRVPMCGVPCHSATTYLERLLREGHSVAICEQVEEAKATKGLIKREVVRLITPGTMIEEGLLEQKANNYLASACIHRSTVGLAFVDLSTGQFLVTQRQGKEPLALLLEELARMRPSECLLPPSLHEELKDKKSLPQAVNGLVLTPLDEWLFSLPRAKESLLTQYEIASLSPLGIESLPLAVRASGAVLHYLKETQKNPLSHLLPPSAYFSEEFMVLSASAIKHLDLLPSGQGKGSSLLEVLDETMTAMGGRRLKHCLLHPMTRLEPIHSRLRAVEELYEAYSQREHLRSLLSQVQDVERLMSRIVSSQGGPAQLLAVKSSLKLVPEVKKGLEGLSSPLLEEIRSSLEDSGDLVHTIERALIEDAPASLAQGNFIKEGYNQQLDELKKTIREGKNFIASLQKEEVRRTGINSLKVGYNRVFGYFIEVSKTNLKHVPPDYQRRQTLANSERFITPELKEFEERILGAEEKAEALEQRLFEDLRLEVVGHIKAIQKNARLLSDLDVLCSLSHVALKRGYCKPEVDEGYDLMIEEGRHPILETREGLPSFVPNDCFLEEGKSQLLLITGPNMAGKSTFLKQIALIVLMAQMGSFVPVRRAKIGLVDRIFTRVGASDLLLQGQSTFMVEMNETAHILNNSTSKSLIILDEIGRGTSTYDGLSIAWAVAEYIHDHLKAKALFATHYHELIELAERLSAAENLHASVREHKGQLIFLYRIERGGSDHSYGLQVAKLAGLPREVLTQSKKLLKDLEHHGLKESKKLKRAEEGAEQLYLFDTSASYSLEERLKELPVERMSPSEALNKLKELKKLVKAEAL